MRRNSSACASRGRCFAPELLEELLTETANTVHEEGDDLIFDHLYIERRMTPLNLFLRTATRKRAERAVLDYGQCIRDLAYTNIFAGDLLLKNFGVTRHGRVIFYDYDELCQVTDCRFRDMPEATNPEDEMRGEAWFYVADNDIFPETFLNFLAFNDAQRAAFLRVHGSPDRGFLAPRAAAAQARARCSKWCPITRIACEWRAAP